jgi:putative intracellular protease/amidase
MMLLPSKPFYERLETLQLHEVLRFLGFEVDDASAVETFLRENGNLTTL